MKSLLAFLTVMVIVAVSFVFAKLLTKSYRIALKDQQSTIEAREQDISKLKKAIDELKMSESEKLKELRHELDGYSHLTDVVAQVATIDENPLAVRDRLREIRDHIATLRPRRVDDN